MPQSICGGQPDEHGNFRSSGYRDRRQRRVPVLACLPENTGWKWKTGFKRFVRDRSLVTVQGAVRVEAPLAVGDASESITVSAETPLVDTESATVSSVVEGRNVDELPLNGRNTMILLATVAGVVPRDLPQVVPAAIRQVASSPIILAGATFRLVAEWLGKVRNIWMA